MSAPTGASMLARWRSTSILRTGLLLLLGCGKGADGDGEKSRQVLWELPQGPQRSSPLASQQPMTFARGTQNWRDISHGDLAQTVGLQEEKASNRRGRRFGEQQHHHEQQPIHNPHQWEPAREGRALAEEARVFPGGLELECDLEVPGSGVLAGGPTIIEPAEGQVVAAGATTNISWILDVFEESTATTDGPSGASSTASLQSDLDIGMVNVTLFNGDAAVWSSFDNSNTGDFSWTIPSDLEEAWTYRVAVWDTASRICGISSEFGISGELSITVTQFEGYNEGGTVDISLLRQGENASSGGGGEIYSCGGSVGIGWSHTGLLEKVDVRVCKERNTSGTLAGLQDEDLQLSTCLDPVGDSVPANSSFLNATLTTIEDEATRDALCAVHGEGFFARVSWVGDGSAADVFGVSNAGAAGTTVPVLGGVFLTPNDTIPMSILEPQLITWEGRTGGGEDAQVDIILRSRTSTSDDDYSVVVASNARSSTDGDFLWEDPSQAFTEEQRDCAETSQESFYLELFDAVGGGLICRSGDFFLDTLESCSSSGESFAIRGVLIIILVGLGFVACSFFFCFFVPRRLCKNARRVPPPTSAQPHGGHTAATPVPALAAEEGRAETKLNHADESGGTMLPEGDRRPTPGLQAEKDETWEELQEAKPRRLEAGERSEEGEAEEGLGI